MYYHNLTKFMIDTAKSEAELSKKSFHNIIRVCHALKLAKNLIMYLIETITKTCFLFCRCQRDRQYQWNFKIKPKNWS